MDGLMLHAGSKTVNREQVYAVPTPAATETWRPVSHKDAVELVLTKLDQIGYRVRSEQHGLAAAGKQYTGVFTLTKDGASEGGDEWSTMVGLRNSHNRTMRLRIGVGQHVWICDNGAFSAERIIGRKHTANIWLDLPALVDQALAKIPSEVEKIAVRTQGLKAVDLDGNSKDVFAITALMVKNDVIPGSKLKAVLEEYAHPTYDAFQARNLWSLYNAFTHHMKDLPPATLIERSRMLTKAFDHIGTRMLEVQLLDKVGEALGGHMEEIVRALAESGNPAEVNLPPGIKIVKLDGAVKGETPGFRFPPGFKLPGQDAPGFGPQGDPGLN